MAADSVDGTTSASAAVFTEAMDALAQSLLRAHTHSACSTLGLILAIGSASSRGVIIISVCRKLTHDASPSKVYRPHMPLKSFC
jgi:hypothetical protein